MCMTKYMSFLTFHVQPFMSYNFMPARRCLAFSCHAVSCASTWSANCMFYILCPVFSAPCVCTLNIKYAHFVSHSWMSCSLGGKWLKHVCLWTVVPVQQYEAGQLQTAFSSHCNEHGFLLHIQSRYCVQFVSIHLHCCKGDASGQWSKANFNLLKGHNFWTDLDKSWHVWLRLPPNPTRQNWWLSEKGLGVGVWMKLSPRVFFYTLGKTG